jgi:hypothetical protein
MSVVSSPGTTPVDEQSPSGNACRRFWRMAQFLRVHLQRLQRFHDERDDGEQTDQRIVDRQDVLRYDARDSRRMGGFGMNALAPLSVALVQEDRTYRCARRWEAEMLKMPQVMPPVHYFSPGVYAREITMAPPCDAARRRWGQWY